MITLLQWILPLAAAAGFVYGALLLRAATLRAHRTRFASPATQRDRTLAYLLQWPSYVVIGALGAGLALALRPFGAWAARLTATLIELAAVGGAVFFAHTGLPSLAERLPEGSPWRRATIRRSVLAAIDSLAIFAALFILGVPFESLVVAAGVAILAAALIAREPLAAAAAGVWIRASARPAPGERIRLPESAETFRLESVGPVRSSLAGSDGGRRLVSNLRLLTGTVEFPAAGSSTESCASGPFFAETRLLLGAEGTLERAARHASTLARTILEENPGWAGPGEPEIRFESTGPEGVVTLIRMPAASPEAAPELVHVFIMAAHKRFKPETKPAAARTVRGLFAKTPDDEP